MFVQRQHFEVEAAGISRRFHGVSHPGLWIHIVEERGCVVDGSFISCLAVGRSTPGRRVAAFLLGGGDILRLDGKRFASTAGDAFVCDGRGFTSHVDATRQPVLSMNIEWDREFFGSGVESNAPSFGRCSVRTTREHVEALRSAIDRAWHDAALLPDVALHVTRLFDALRADGFEVPRVSPRDLTAEVVDPSVRALSRALDSALALRGERPAMSDLEHDVSLSPRTVQRQLPKVLAAWGQTTETFRDLRCRYRLFQACMLMSHPQVTTEGAARILGFASANALCRAFLDRGLPSPGRVREALAALT